MSSSKTTPTPAQSEKDKGDASFKAGDFPSAVGHYSAAIVHDRNDYRLTLNRAAAYLKLGKYEDASRDCTTTLKLSPNNAKALFRRSQARVGSGALREAEEDLKAVVKLQPSDVAIKKELERVSKLLLDEKARESKVKQPVEIPPSATAPVRRRRIPIKIVEAEDKEPELEPIPIPKPKSPTTVIEAKPPKSILKKAPSTKIEKIIVPEKPVAPAPPKPVAPAPPKPVRVGGGIFRANGSQTVFPVRDVTLNSDATKPKPKTNSTVVGKMPSNLFDLNKIWEMCSTPEDRFHLLTTIPASQFPAFFQTSLEPGLLTSILQTFLDVLDSDSEAKVVQYMNALSTVPRFATLLLFLSAAERDTAKRLLARLDTSTLSPVWKKTL